MTIIRLVEKRERRADDPGFPFSTWEIWTERIEGAATSETEYPIGDVLQRGKAFEKHARVYLDPERERIVVRPFHGVSAANVRRVVDWAHERRISGDFGIGMSLAELRLEDGPVEVGTIGRNIPVIRCEVMGCDQFGRWHAEDASTLDRCGEHIACERSTSAYTCRLVYEQGFWVPRVSTRARFVDDPIRSAESLAFALLDVTSSARELNRLDGER